MLLRRVGRVDSHMVSVSLRRPSDQVSSLTLNCVCMCFVFVPQQPDLLERSRAVASHGVGSRPYRIQLGTAELVYAPSFNSGGTMAAGQREARTH